MASLLLFFSSQEVVFVFHLARTDYLSEGSEWDINLNEDKAGGLTDLLIYRIVIELLRPDHQIPPVSAGNATLVHTYIHIEAVTSKFLVFKYDSFDS